MLNIIRIACVAAVGISFGLSVDSSRSAPITFFGEDLSPGGSLPAGGNAETARDNFLSFLTGGFGVEDFEGFTAGATQPLSLSFDGSIGSVPATLSGSSGAICDTNVNCLPPAAGEFPISGDRWFAVDTGFDVAFDSGIRAFGFFGTDVGDFGLQLELLLTLASGATETLAVGNGSTGGSVLFFGFVDFDNYYTNIAFSGLSGDFIGVDDMIIGEVPIPAALPLLATALGGLGLLGWRRKRAAQAAA